MINPAWGATSNTVSSLSSASDGFQIFPVLCGSEWKQQTESRPPAHLGDEVECAVVQLHYSIAHGQADATAGALGREIQIEDFIANLRRDAASLIAHFDRDCSIQASRHNVKQTTAAHGLHTVKDDIEQGLLDEISVGANWQRLTSKIGSHIHPLACGFRRCQGNHFFGQA